MTEQVASGQPPQPAGSTLRIARALVLLGFGVLPACFLVGGTVTLRGWIGFYVFCVGLAALATGALALFFTKSQARHSARNFVVALWVSVALSMLMGWASHEQDKREAAAPTAPNPFSDPNFGKSPPQQ